MRVVKCLWSTVKPVLFFVAYLLSPGLGIYLLINDVADKK